MKSGLLGEIYGNNRKTRGTCRMALKSTCSLKKGTILSNKILGLIFFPAISRSPFFNLDPKKDPHIHIPAGFPVPGGSKSCGKKCLDIRAFDGHQERGISPAFCQNRLKKAPISTRS